VSGYYLSCSESWSFKEFSSLRYCQLRTNHKEPCCSVCLVLHYCFRLFTCISSPYRTTFNETDHTKTYDTSGHTLCKSYLGSNDYIHYSQLQWRWGALEPHPLLRDSQHLGSDVFTSPSSQPYDDLTMLHVNYDLPQSLSQSAVGLSLFNSEMNTQPL